MFNELILGSNKCGSGQDGAGLCESDSEQCSKGPKVLDEPAMVQGDIPLEGVLPGNSGVGLQTILSRPARSSGHGGSKREDCGSHQG